MIGRDDWSQWSALLDEVLELEIPARALWLAELRALQPEAARTIERLLGHEVGHATAPAVALLGALGDGAGVPTASRYQRTLQSLLNEEEATAAAVPGQSFGPWQVSRRLGVGGMGEVWLATRADRLYEGQAAIKLVAAGGDTRRLGARFARERNLLARLTHPGIARLLDAGVSGEQPYLVLEYVAGDTLLDYARLHAPTLASRLQLVLAIGRAVEHAHSRLIVHRDLKPANVVVNADGEVKLLDFGIAALMDDADDPDSSLTRLYGRGLTLDYAAPEQIAGEATGVGCDVYSLGVMLFELLAGMRPLYGERAGRTSLEHAVLHSEAPRLSRALAAASAADAPDGARPQDVQRVRGDLEAVVAKALRKSPEDRYTTMAAFMADIENWLAHRPVSARRGDWRTRSRLWFRRNRLATGLALAIVISLGIGLGISLWQWQRALQEAQKAEAVQTFLVSLFEAPNGWTSKSPEPTLRSVVEAGAQRVEKELSGQPDIQLTLNEVLRATYQAFGDYRNAEALANRSVQLSEQVYGHDSVARAHAINALANLIYDEGRYDEAAPLLEESLRIVRLHFSKNSLEVADYLNDFAAAEAARGHVQESLKLRREAVQVFENDSKADPDQLARIRSDYALALDRAGQWRESVAENQFAVQKAGTPPGTLSYSIYEHNVGCVQARLGLYADAERNLRDAAEIRRLDAEGHPYLGITLSNYAVLLDELGRNAEARTIMDEGLKTLRDTYGADNATVAKSEIRQSLIVAHAGDLPRAEAIARAALPRVGANAPLDVARAHRALGEILLLAGRTDAAVDELGQASSVLLRLLGAEHPEAAMAQGVLAIAQSRLGQASARATLSAAIDTLASKVEAGQVTLLRLRRALEEVDSQAR